MSSTAAPSSSSPAAPAVDRDSQTVTLPDGRTLGFAEYGAPDGSPVIYLHGFPSNRLEGQAFDKAAKQHRVRLLSLDRPGMGLSTLQPGRTMLDWPDDVLAFAETQSISKFGVLGASGGGPYVLACARKLPPTALTHVGIMCGAGDFSAASRKAGVIPRRSRWADFLARHWPWAFQMFLGSIVGLARWIVRTKTVTRRIDAWLATMDQKEAERKAEERAAKKKELEVAGAESGARASDTRSEGSVDDSFEEVNGVAGSVESLSTVATTRPGSSKAVEAAAFTEDVVNEDEDDGTPKQTIPQRREAMLRAVFETFAQGCRATLEDARVLASDLGIKYEEITFDPVMVWHGDEDVNTPLPWIKLITDRIPHASLKVYPGKSHYTLAEDIDEIIAHFSPDSGLKKDTPSTEQ
ncbi:hypothetical protein SCUCBS95973_005814 [Sporothrix curviconia]|uniref:AB hydrolase-1 domain-containing protein n=1 Tax=Sporothrix curviconia TaxID=1260050 RepID=A0ABP0C291_9PEZI